MIRLKPETKYCAFLGALGYGDIVMSVDRSTNKKLELLDGVFNNLQSTISHITLKKIRKKYGRVRYKIISVPYKHSSNSLFLERYKVS